MSNTRTVSRRAFIGNAALLAGAAAAPALIASPAAHAQQKVPQASVQVPGQAQRESEMQQLSAVRPGSSPAANGSCKVVDGAISPNGYCAIWVAKP
jgi:hypothetical protein